MSFYQDSKEGTVITVRVIPRSSQNSIEGLLGDALKVRLQAPPVDGKANKALIKFLSKALKIPASQFSILSGETGRNKRIHIDGIKGEKLKALLHL